MRRTFFVLILGMALATTAAWAESWTGYVSDAKCGAKHNKGTQADINCVNACIKGGSEAVLVVGDKVVPIANKDKVSEFHGKKVTVNGKLEGNKITVESAKAAE
ncbi:MAG: hypothetical protein IT169_03895 [Bryobacterales bacterium]|nr:hypothetical protein [Bryobacterales bacterium]